jgi:hypothetical protein
MTSSEKPPEDDFSDPDERDDDDDAPPERAGFATKMLGDLARRALTTGIGAVFLSEESLRSQLSEMKLPKEAMNYVVAQADKTKKEIVATIARETREFLSKLEMDKILGRALLGTTIEIQTRIKILPKEDGGVQTKVESTTEVEQPKRRRRKKTEADETDPPEPDET